MISMEPQLTTEGASLPLAFLGVPKMNSRKCAY